MVAAAKAVLEVEGLFGAIMSKSRLKAERLNCATTYQTLALTSSIIQPNLAYLTIRPIPTSVASTFTLLAKSVLITWATYCAVQVVSRKFAVLRHAE
jgi:hypothetical protein